MNFLSLIFVSFFVATSVTAMEDQSIDKRQYYQIDYKLKAEQAEADVENAWTAYVREYEFKGAKACPCNLRDSFCSAVEASNSYLIVFEQTRNEDILKKAKKLFEDAKDFYNKLVDRKNTQLICPGTYQSYLELKKRFEE